MFNTQILAGSSGQGGGEVQQSLKFNDDESQYLSWAPAAAGNLTTWTWSGWVKRANLGGTQAIFSTATTNDVIYLNVNNQLVFYTTGGYYSTPPNVFRDTSAWYHFVFVWDTNNATQADRIRVYLNGERLAFGSGTQAASGATSGFNNNVVHGIGYAPYVNSYFLDGYLSDIYFIDGQALDASSFGQFTDGYWEKKDYAGTYGTNGFHLTFADDVVSEGFNTVTYAGNGSTQSISGLGFEPDLVWIKSRSGTSGAFNHTLWDAVRGAGADKELTPNLTYAEGGANTSLYGYVSALDVDGFSLAAGSTNSTQVNGSSTNYVGWAWDAGENNAPTGHSSVTYTGNGGTQSIKGLGFEPDLVWIKSRSFANNHHLFDSVRGAGKILRSSTTEAESTLNVLSSFDSSGFTVAETGGNNATNDAGSTYVAWGWDAGSGSPVSNTDGSITSTVKANPATGFSVVSWSGSSAVGTIGHGLSAAPELIITKRRDFTTAWHVYSATLGNTNGLYLNDTAASTAFGPTWNSTSPTSSVFSVGDGNWINQGSMIAYCFNSVAGYSSIGSYTGTGAAGNVVTTGFPVGFVMIKNTDAASSWVIFDNTRNPFSPQTQMLRANTSGAEETKTDREPTFTSTGFTIGDADADTNVSGNTYIYMAFKGSYSDYVSDLNTDGTIDSRVKANPATGFSITSYVGNGTAGATIGHGLSSAPDIMIVKGRNTTAAQAWRVYHKDSNASPASGVLNLNTNGAFVSSSTQWNNTAPTSSVFSVGTDPAVNENTKNYIAYCFNSVAGYSSIGSYTGNGSASGPTVTTGFRPAFVMFKNADGADDWVILDSTRNPSNPVNSVLFPSGSYAEETNANRQIEISDTGFQVTSSGQWINGSGQTIIYMAFADTREAAFWKDVSGNNNNWTPNNLDYRDSLIDSPANNFATFNPVSKALYQPTFSNGNLSLSTSNAWNGAAGTIGVTSGKWYWEIVTEAADTFVGICADDLAFSASDPQTLTGTILYYGGNGNKRVDGALTSYGSSFASGDIIGVALDIDSGTITFYKNNVSQGSISLSSSTLNGKTILPYFVKYYASTMTLNFGQDSTFSGARPAGGNQDANGVGDFKYAPPSGYLALCTANLPTPSIVDGSEHFNTVLFSANNSTQSITGVGFQPDWVWTKSRTNAYSHGLYDSVRGVNLRLRSDTTGAEVSQTNMLNSFDADGFSLGQNDDANYLGSGVAWNWKAGGTAVSNTAGSITSQVSANTDAGFSIVSWTGSGTNYSIGHGLSQAPEFFVVKRRDAADNWMAFHSSVITPSATNKSYIWLNNSSGVNTNSVATTFTSSTSSVIGLGTDTTAAGINDRLVGYAFHSVEGFSKAGSYTGNGSSDGTFVYTGFRPAWIMLKRSDGTENWLIYDTERDSHNVTDEALLPNSSSASGGSANAMDILSNGFKFRATSGSLNASGGDYIFLAFASTPFKYATAR